MAVTFPHGHEIVGSAEYTSYDREQLLGDAVRQMDKLLSCVDTVGNKETCNRDSGL